MYTQILLYLSFLLTSVCRAFSDSKPAVWQLEDYNGWNLPFMKTIQIKATDDRVNFPKSNYAMEVDPSAYFSVIFTDLDIAKVDNPITLNYTFYGS